MSTSPSVIRRFVEYYAGLDAQPPSALAALYHPDATLSDPFGQHQGLVQVAGQQGTRIDRARLGHQALVADVLPAGGKDLFAGGFKHRRLRVKVRVKGGGLADVRIYIESGHVVVCLKIRNGMREVHSPWSIDHSRELQQAVPS